ncbi:MAG: Crp/Fnr family transcriptional regulator [Ignavibacteriales bacterium]|nr:Crp/Fnr family transcriptional regulator [Ignavibacteriales bacterium]
MKEKPSICTSCSHRKGSIFCALPQSLLERMEREKITYHYQPGQLIFSEGNPAFMIYHVFSGYVKLSKTGWKGEKLVIRLRGPGDIFGHRAVLSGEPYTADAMALEETTLCAIQKEIFLQAIKESPEFALRVMAKLSSDLRASEEQTMSITHENVRQRVARLLLFLIEDNEESRRNRLIIPNSLSREEMAQMIGTTPESLSRTLHLFTDKKLIVRTRSEIRIIDLEALRSLLPKMDSD